MKKRIVIPLLAALLIFLICSGYAGNYLAYRDLPRASDAVVLFVGPGFEARQQEACDLIDEWKPKLLIIPAYNVVIPVNGRKIPRIRPITDAEYRAFKAKTKKDFNFWYENTHVEVMEAKRLLDAHGARSAIFVSSPYHMRRIKMITESVLDRGNYAVLFVPARGEAAMQPGGIASVREWCRQLGEYAKIAWFLMYRPLVDTV
jgi:hypothetical protein